MIRDLGRWPFYGKYAADYTKVYPTVKGALRLLLENLISSRILLPTSLNQNTPLHYKDLDELMYQIEATGYLDAVTEFDIFGDTVMYTSTGEDVCQDITRIVGFRTSSPYFTFVIRKGDWLPMTINPDTEEFSWNLERYQLNYHRIPTLLKKLDVNLGWENEALTIADDYFATTKAGYDFFIEKTVIAWEYNQHPNPDFNLDAYLSAIKDTLDKYPY